MRKTSIFSLATLMLVACNQVNTSGEKTITQGEDTVGGVEISVSKTDGLVNALEELEKADAPKLLFRASGSEPGWIMDMYTNKLRLIVDYGNDSLWIDGDFTGVNSEKGFSYAKAESSNGK